MKKATQPNGISLTPGNCSSATRSWLDRSVTPYLIELRPAAADWGRRRPGRRADV